MASNAVSTQSGIQKLLQAEDLIKENADISKKLETLKQDIKSITKASSLSRDQLELL